MILQRKYGAVIIRDKNEIVSCGYNGFPKKMQDKAEWYNNREEKYSRIIHGEINALIFAKQDVYDCALYTYPFLPCDRCAVQMIQAGITTFVAPTPTEDQLTRWKESFDKTKQYIAECGLTIIEVPDFK